MESDTIQAIDFGGTNLRIGQVSPITGELVGPVFKQGMASIRSNEKLTSIILAHLTRGIPVGISAAGTVDEEELIITKSPNSPIKGKITFGADLRKEGFKVAMTNDMRASALAAAMYGEGRRNNNVLVATYSSGFNCAVVRGLQNVTEAEFGHMPYCIEGNLKCGCGGVGHLEVFVSGNGATQMARRYLSQNHIQDHPILEFTAKRTGRAKGKLIKAIRSDDVYNAYRESPDMEPQHSIREIQVQAIADSFGMMNSAYNPLDVMVLMGSQTNDWGTLFEPAIKTYREGRLQLPTLSHPQIVRTQLPEIGLQGAAAYFLQKHF